MLCKEKADLFRFLSQQDMLLGEKVKNRTFLAGIFVIEGLEGGVKGNFGRSLNPLKHRRQKLPIAPPSSTRFPPPFPEN